MRAFLFLGVSSHLYSCVLNILHLQSERMKAILKLLIVFISITCTGCYTLTLIDGRNYTVWNLAKDQVPENAFDTSKFIKQPFRVSDYTNKRAFINDKRVIVSLRGTDLKAFSNTKGKYYLHFLNPTCSGAPYSIHRLDSLSKAGYNIITVSNRRSYNVIDRRLGKTNFAQYPYYIVDAADYTDYLLWREVGFKQEACPECYAKCEDHIPVVEFILIDDGVVKFIEYYSEDNPIKR